MSDAKLYEYDKIEWRDILKEAVRSSGGKWSEDKFEEDWNEFIKLKNSKCLN